MFKFFESIGNFITAAVTGFIGFVNGLIDFIALMVDLFDWTMSGSFSALLPEFAVPAVALIISVAIYKFLINRGY